MGNGQLAMGNGQSAIGNGQLVSPAGGEPCKGGQYPPLAGVARSAGGGH